tara:strand:- start:298 stop:447 length:150 start_codon:yes stop_codon:yes gene_type:complete
MIVWILLLVLTVSCSSDSYTWYGGTIDDAISSIEPGSSKLVMLDFYADG